MNKVVFRNENQGHYVCEIVERDDCYELMAQGRKGVWHKAIFSKDAYALAMLEEAIRKWGNPKYYQKGFVFYSGKGRQQYESRLAQVLYVAYHRSTRDVLNGKNLQFKDGDAFNLRKDNLLLMCKVQIVTLNGTEYIMVKQVKKDGKIRCAITNYSRSLYEILNSCDWNYEESNRCFRANRKGACRYRLSFVVWAYNKYSITPDNWMQRCQEIRQDFGKYNLSIDHKKVTGQSIGKWDNRAENLQAIPIGDNALKSSCTMFLPENCFYIPTLDGAVYGKIDMTDGVLVLSRMDNDPGKEEIKQLRNFCKTGEVAEGSKCSTIALNSKEAVEVLVAAYNEAKFHEEVYNVC